MFFRCIVVFAVAVFGVSVDARCVYPVRLNNYGPAATTVPIVNSHVQTRIVERVPLRTLGCIPQPRTISNTCTCVKTIVKPQVHNQIISVPSVQRIIQTTAAPVIEKIHYPATPVEPICPIPAVGPIVPTCGAGLIPAGARILTPACGPIIPVSPCGCGCGAKAIFL